MNTEHPRRRAALPKAVRAIRLSLGLTQIAFAPRIGARPGEISNYEAGKKKPGAMRLMKLIRIAPKDHQKPLLLELKKYGLTVHDIGAPETIQQQPEARNEPVAPLMKECHLVTILTGLLRAQAPELDGDAAVLQAIALARGGMGESEVAGALDIICWGRSLTPAEIRHDVGSVL